MKKYFILFLIGLFTFSAFAQTQFTPYDNLPGIEKMYKPTYNPAFSGWEKMLYEYPVNFKTIDDDFNSWIQQNPNEKSAIIRYYKIWKRAVENYSNEKGEINIPNIDALLQEQFNTQKAAINLQKSTSFTTSDWSFLGPKETFWRNETNLNSDRIDENGDPKQCPWQANVYAFDVANSNKNILYCGTETGFVNKSTDNGITWIQLGKDYPFGGGIPAVAIDPENADIVYVSAGKQIHKTTDGGTTWTPLLDPTKKFEAHRIKINPENTDILIAAANEGLYLSTDAGTSWVRKWNQTTYDVEFNAADPNIIYGISKNLSGMYKIVISSNGGENFESDPDFPTNYTETSGGLLAVTKANSNALFATLLAKEGVELVPFILKGTFADDKFTWEELKKGEYQSIGGLGGFTNGQGYFDLVLEVAPNDENLVFWGTCSLWKSTDGGSNYNGVGGYNGDFPIHPDIQDIKILENGEMWVATDGGMNYSTDYFTSQENYYSRTKGIIGSEMWGFDQGWNEDIIVGGRYHNGNTAISDLYGNKALRMGGAESATGWVIKGKSRHVAFDDLGNGWILPKTSTEVAEGRFIFSKFPNMDEYGGRRSNLVQHPNYYGTVYVGEENSIWESNDFGETFDLLFQFPDKIRYFQISQKNPNVLYADIISKGLYKSEDGGISWVLKPTLTNGSYGNSNWNGKLFFDISPYDENKIYVCLQNGTWSDDIGEIFYSDNGGDTWTDWTDGMAEYTKCLVIQPTNNGKDLVYLFTTAKNGYSSKVYSRIEGQPYWNAFSENYPAGMSVNLALPFFRDSKLRVAGNAGVWETKMAQESFTPLINPWVEKDFYSCMEDTLYFDDHSIINHEGANWNWEIQPEPLYISDANARNPKVVLGNPGSYDVKLTVTQNGETYVKSISEMVATTTCPSVDDCDNPAEIDKSNWELMYTDSEEVSGEDGKAINAFDGDLETFWHSAWYFSAPDQPHEIQIDLGEEYLVSKIMCLPRQSSANGRIKDYEIYVSKYKTNWGTPVAKGAFEAGANKKTIELDPVTGRYIRLKSLSEQNGQKFTTLAELDVVACRKDNSTAVKDLSVENMKAYPIPATSELTIDLPGNHSGKWNYKIIAVSGQVVQNNSFVTSASSYTVDLHNFKTGLYYLIMQTENAATYRIKFIKK